MPLSLSPTEDKQSLNTLAVSVIGWPWWLSMDNFRRQLKTFLFAQYLAH